MAYPHQQVEYPLLTTAGNDRLLCSTTGSKASIWFGRHPYIVRAVGFAPMVTTAIVTEPKFSIRLVTGGNGKASATGDQIATLTMASGANRGSWRLRANLNTAIRPGSELNVVVITKATQACPVRGFVMVEPDWETTGNITTITTVTA